MADWGGELFLMRVLFWLGFWEVKIIKVALSLRHFTQKNNASNLWREVMDSVEAIWQGLRPAIGNGRSTLFDVPVGWWEAVIGRGDIITKIGCPLLKGYWLIGWRVWMAMRAFWLLPAKILQKIAFLTFMEAYDHGLLFWGPSKSCEFTIKSALHIIHNESHLKRDPVWWIVWHSKNIPRIQMFFWAMTSY